MSVAWLLSDVGPCVDAQNVTTAPIITTVAGNGTQGYSGDGGPATSAELYEPIGVAVDRAGDLYIADWSNSRIRKVNTSGIITTVAGNGIQGYSGDGGPATSAELNGPHSVAVDSAGNIYVADTYNNCIRKVDTTGIITTVAGNGTAGYGGDGGPATSAELSGPAGVAIDSTGNLYIADQTNSRIRKVDRTGIITTVAGDGTRGYSGDGGPAISAELFNPTGIAIDSAGKLYIADWTNSRVRKVDTSGIITTVAGNGIVGYSGDGGPATSAELHGPLSVAVDSEGDIYIADGANYRIRKVDPSGIVTTVAGNGTQAYSGDGGPAASAEIGDPPGVAVDSAGDLYIADSFNGRIREVYSPRINAAGPRDFGAVNVGASNMQNFLLSINSPLALTNVKASGDYSVLSNSCALNTVLVAGTNCTLQVQFAPTSPGLRWFPLTVTDSNSDMYSFGLEGAGIGPALAFTPGIIATVAGTGFHGYTGDGGLATSAELNSPSDVSVDSAGNVFIADEANNRVRKVSTSGIIMTVVGNGIQGYSGDGGPATSAELNGPHSVAVDSAGNLYIADDLNSRIRKVDASGNITTVAGNGTPGYSGDGGPATSAELYFPSSVAVDGAGNLYIADKFNDRIRKVDASGIITTVAGNGAAGYSGDGGQATSAELYWPSSVAVDRTGNLYIADEDNYVVRKVSTSGVITTVGGNGTQGYSGDGGPATSAQLESPGGVALDSAGNLYIADNLNSRIRKVDATGIITTVAGNGTPGYSGDGGPATSAELNFPSGVAVDSAGSLYSADMYGNRIRKISVTSAALSFSALTAGQSSTDQSVLVSNVGNAPLNFFSFGVSSNFHLASVGGECTVGTPLAPGTNCSLGALFAPTFPGNPLTGTITVSDDAFNSPQSVSLSGIAQGVLVPNVVGDTQTAATSAITALGLVVGTVTKSSSSTVPSGSVISESPAAGAAVNPGSAVSLVISSGVAQEQLPGQLQQISVGADGTVWGVTSGDNIYAYSGQSQAWQNIQGLLKQVAVGANGYVWGINAAGDIYRFDPNTDNWDSIPGNLSQIAVGADEDVWGVNNGNNVYHYDSATQNWDWRASNMAQVALGFDGAVWALDTSGNVFRFTVGTQSFQQMPGLLSQISVGADGDVWGINSAEEIYHFNTLTQNWEQIPGSLVQISVGSATNVVGVNAVGGVYQFNNASQTWIQIAGTLRQISAGANGSVWGLDASGNVFQVFDGVSSPRTFHQVPGSVAQIAAASDNNVWGINSAGFIYHFNPLIQNWDNVPGQLTQIAVGAGGNVWGINSGGFIYRFDAPSQSWVNVPGSLSQIAAGHEGDVWGINSAGFIYRFNSLTQNWDNVPGQLAQISVGVDGTVWGINSEGFIYRFDGNGWVNVPGLLSQIAVGSADNVWGINSAGLIYRFDTSIQSWVNLPGNLSQISVAFDGTVWGVNSGGFAYRFDLSSQSWVYIGGADFFAQVSVGADAAIWVKGSDGGIYTYW